MTNTRARRALELGCRPDPGRGEDHRDAASERSGGAPPVDALQPHGHLRGPRGAGDRAGRGRLRLGPTRQEVPRWPLGAFHHPDRPRPHGVGRGRSQAGRDPRVLPAVDLRPPAGDRARRPGGRLSARRPQPCLLHYGRLRGGRVGLEAGAPVLPADRAAAAHQGDQPVHRVPRHVAWARCPSPAFPELRTPFEPLVPGAIKVPNTNFYRADMYARRRRGVRPLGRRRDRAGHLAGRCRAP